MREICLDTETTGLDPKDGHRIIEIGCVELINKVKTGNNYHIYINPQREIPKEAFDIHGISNEFLKDKPLFEEIAQQFYDFIYDARLIIHNAAFDMKFINYELRQCNLEIIERGLVDDSLLIARQKFPGSANSLDALCKRFNIDSSKRIKHGALLDAELLADIYIELMGGRQSSMFEDPILKKKNQDIIVKNKIIRKNLKYRQFPLTKEEEDLHKEFIVKNFKENIWGF